MRTQFENEGQNLFDFVLLGFFLVCKLLLKILIWSPFLITAYLIVSLMLNKNDHAILWLIMLALFAYVLYFLFGLLRGLSSKLKAKGNFCWLPLFIVCVVFSCAAPIWMVFATTEKMISRLSHHNIEFLSWIICLVFGLYLCAYHKLLKILK